MRPVDGLRKGRLEADWKSKSLWALSWPIAFFSAWTSANGLYAFFSNSLAADAWWYWPFFLCVATAFHLVAVISYMQFRDHGLKRGLAAYIVLTSAAVLLSFAWHWRHFNGVSYARNQYEQNRAEIVRALHNAKDGSSQIVSALVALQAYSAVTAKTEEEIGGTCGGEARKKPGVRYHFRVDDKEVFTAILVSANQRDERLGKLLAEAQELPMTAVDTTKAVPQLMKITDGLSAFVGDDRLVASIRQQVEERLLLARTGIGTENGKPVVCPDARRETLIRAVTDATKTPTFTTSHVIDPTDAEEAQKAAWGRIFSWSMRMEDWIAVAAASLVEFVLFILLTLIPRRRRLWVGDEFETLDELTATCDWVNVDALRHLVQEHAESDMAFIRLVEEHTFWDRILWYRTPILAVPAHSETNQQRTLRIIAVVLTRCAWATRPWTPDWFYRLRLRLRWSDTPLRRLARGGELTFYKLDARAWESILLAMAMTGKKRPRQPDADGSPTPPLTLPLLPYFGPAK